MNNFNNSTPDALPPSKANMKSERGKSSFLFTNSMNDKKKRGFKYSLFWIWECIAKMATRSLGKKKQHLRKFKTFLCQHLVQLAGWINILEPARNSPNRPTSVNMS